MTNKVDMADVCELAHELTIEKLGSDKAERVTYRGGVTVRYTKAGQEAFDHYYDMITNILQV